MLVSAVSVLLHGFFLRNERIALIDQQVRATAEALLGSELADLGKIDFGRADEIISEELGESRIGKFFIIRNDQGEMIYESVSASLLPITEVPREPRWFEIRTKGKFIRGLNLKLPHIQDRTLQVGLVLDASLIDPSLASWPFFIFLLVLFGIGLIASQLLTSALLRPIARLSGFLTEVTETPPGPNDLPTLPTGLARSPRLSSTDEFERVLAGLNRLIERVNRNHRLSRLWAYQMAHELKTPLSIAGIEVEKLQEKASMTDDDVADLLGEHRQISETITAFLAWAEIESSPGRKDPHPHPLDEMLTSLIQRLPEARERVEFSPNVSRAVRANRLHLEQLLTNLLQNALTHSPPRSKVRLRIEAQSLEIENEGSPIPPDVLARLGEPFNRGPAPEGGTRRGHGLGLAWINSICRLYDWELTFTRNDSFNLARVVFRP